MWPRTPDTTNEKPALTEIPDQEGPHAELATSGVQS